MEEVTLSDEQQRVLDATIAWRKQDEKKCLSIGGFAGVGKTTVIGKLVNTGVFDCAEPIAVAAFTGKAASVLRKKGITQAQTLHSLMYKPMPGPNGTVIYERLVRLGVRTVIVDEAQMLNKTLHDDLQSFGVHVLYIGDMGQLEPIGENPQLMRNPDLRLETIHRQAQDSPIIRLSMAIREGKLIRPREYPGIRFGNFETLADSLLEYDQILCGFNRTRKLINDTFRRHYRRKKVVEAGDRLICLLNNRKLGIFNGLMGDVKEVHDISQRKVVATIEDDSGTVHPKMVLDALQFGRDKLVQTDVESAYTYWDYGYCLSVHKSSGSEWRGVAVYREIHPNWDAKRWMYTAVTRARENLLLCR